MRPSTKAMLLSALVLPGLGQMYLKRTKAGLIIMSIVLIDLILILALVMSEVTTVLGLIQASGSMPDIVTISTEVHRVFIENIWVKVLGFELFLVWFYAVLDAWRSGRTPA
ncbi:MAG: hypothetical protein OEZ39_15010 [Gammaproteobacteria bacterium]|nr:hypothetical protein [Gammaproteobacteria bacterium]MDH5653163.1 hypothetical protein [Gammaproteobacteria bacterium]